MDTSFTTSVRVFDRSSNSKIISFKSLLLAYVFV